MKRKKINTTIIAAIITTVGVILSATITGYFNLIANTSLPTPGYLITTQTPSSNYIHPLSTLSGVENLTLNILNPIPNAVFPLFEDEFHFYTFSANSIIIEFIITDANNESLDTRNVFLVQKQPLTATIYYPDYSHRELLVYPVNENSSLSNHYFASFKILPVDGRYIEGKYVLELRTDSLPVQQNYIFDKSSFTVDFFIQNTLDPSKIINEIIVVIVLFFILFGSMLWYLQAGGYIKGYKN